MSLLVKRYFMLTSRFSDGFHREAELAVGKVENVRGRATHSLATHDSFMANIVEQSTEAVAYIFPM